MYVDMSRPMHLSTSVDVYKQAQEVHNGQQQILHGSHNKHSAGLATIKSNITKKSIAHLQFMYQVACSKQSAFAQCITIYCQAAKPHLLSCISASDTAVKMQKCVCACKQHLWGQCKHSIDIK